MQMEAAHAAHLYLCTAYYVSDMVGPPISGRPRAEWPAGLTS